MANTDKLLSKIQINGVVYTLKDAVARGLVVANPEDETTTSLSKLKVGDTTYKIASGGSTVIDSETNGNIVVDGEEMVVYEMPQAYKDYLDEVTFKKPEISTFQILDASGTSVAGTYEVGSTVSVAKFKHKEKNISNISGKLKLGTLDVEAVEADTIIELSAAEDVTATKTYTLSGTDTRGGDVSKTATITFNTYAYSKLTTDDTAPTSSLTKEAEQGSFKSNGKDFTYVAGQYLYIYLTETGKQAQTNVLGQWVDVTSVESGPIAITKANGTSGNYYAYRIGPFVANGTAKYRVK